MPPISTPTYRQSQPSSSQSSSRPSSPIPQTPIHPMNILRKSSNPSFQIPQSPPINPPRHAPYMVALSGWPEPIYIAEPRSDWERKRSRPGTPKRNSLNVNSPISTSLNRSTDSGAEFAVPALPTSVKSPVNIPPEQSIFGSNVSSASEPATLESLGDEENIDPSLRDHCMLKDTCGCPFPTHPHDLRALYPEQNQNPPVNGVSTHPLPSSTATHHPNHPASSLSFPTSSTRGQTSIPEETYTNSTPTKKGSSFIDPRYGPTAAILENRGHALRVVPSWSGLDSSPSTSSSMQKGDSIVRVKNTLSGGKINGTGIFVLQRAVPEVYPPRVNMRGKDGEGGHVATEVYPRDPDTALLWALGGKGGKGEGMDME